MTLAERIHTGDAFQGYAYAYPHKTAYRPLDPVIPLNEAWAEEDKSSLFLYVHVPFCEMRCGFCNLFTTTHPSGDLVLAYLSSLKEQAAAVSDSLGPEARFARLAIGGGTPTFLKAEELHTLFHTLENHFALERGAPRAVELSPATSTPERIEVLKAWEVSRVSLGVQSFIESETRTLGRHQVPREVRTALERLRGAGFPVLNVDLIYGTRGQTVSTWIASIREAIAFHPEEIYLYPLYVRPLTGLGKHGDAPSDQRLELYQAGRDFLLANGYRQISMRLFRATRYRPPEGPAYCCQEDGMVGIGAGARSYTRACHYSTEWAVGRTGVRAIIDDYVGRTPERFHHAEYGCRLLPAEQRRRYIIKSLLRAEGLDCEAYCEEFGTDVDDDFLELRDLDELGLASRADGVIQLNAQGLGLSDVIGPWLFSTEMQARMAEYTLT